MAGRRERTLTLIGAGLARSLASGSTTFRLP